MKIEYVRRVTGFVIGFSLAALAEFVLLVTINGVFDTRLMPRGIGWIVMPCLAGVALARIMADKDLGELIRGLGFSSQARYMLAGTLFWFILVGGYLVIADPFGRRMLQYEWAELSKWLLVPPAIAVVGLFLYRWASRKAPA